MYTLTSNRTPSGSSRKSSEPQQHQSEHRSFRCSDFDGYSIIGKGAFADVYEARNIDQDFRVALKIVVKKDLRQKGIKKEQLCREVEIQHGLRHKHILRLFAYFEDDDRCYIVLEVGRGSVYRLLIEKVRLTLYRTCYILDSVADALIYCHSKGVVHRDLKPENVILATSALIPKLCDFGWAVKDDARKPRNTICGTEDYVAPELANGDEYDYRVDNWALGVLAYECLTGQLPHRQELDQAPLGGIHRRGYVFSLIVKCNYDDAVITLPGQIANIVRNLLRPNVAERMELSDLVKEPFLREQVAMYHKICRDRCISVTSQK